MEKCMAAVNSNLLKHNLMMAIDDRGKISCHKVNICFIYIQPSECIVSILVEAAVVAQVVAQVVV